MNQTDQIEALRRTQIFSGLDGDTLYTFICEWDGEVTDCCSLEIVRTWMARDGSGNSSTCSQRITVEAAVHGNRNTAYQALLAHPLGPAADKAEAVLDDMLTTHRAHLPQFFGE